MPRFLDGITIVNKNGTTIKIDSPILQGKASSSIDGANTYGTYVLRDASGRFQVDTPVNNNDVANKKYVDDRNDPIIEYLEEASENMQELLLRDSASAQTVRGDIRYSGVISNFMDIVTKEYVNSYGKMSFTLNTNDRSNQFPRNNAVTALMVAWGDGGKDLVSITPHVYSDFTEYEGAFYFVTEIGVGAFKDCDNLESISIPGSVAYIGNYAFMNCVNLKNISIPESITYIGDSAFENCFNLEEMYVYGKTPPELGTDVFKDVNGNLIIYVPTASYNIYKNTAGWKDFDIRSM